MSIWQEWTTNNRYKKSKKTNTRNMNTKTNTKTTVNKIFTMRRLIIIRILISKNCMGY